MTAADDYIESLPKERRNDIAIVRDVVNQHLPAGYVEGVGYGMITWSIPLSRYPDTYNGQPLAIAALAAQKNYSSLYLMGVYGDADGATRLWFEDAWTSAGKKLDMGKSCVRFRAAGDLALDVVAKAIGLVSVADYLEHYERVKGVAGRKSGAAPAAKKKLPRSTTKTTHKQAPTPTTKTKTAKKALATKTPKKKAPTKTKPQTKKKKKPAAAKKKKS